MTGNYPRASPGAVRLWRTLRGKPRGIYPAVVAKIPLQANIFANSNKNHALVNLMGKGSKGRA